MTTNGERNDIAYAAIRTCAKNILFAVAQSNALDNGVSLATFQGKALKGDVRAAVSESVAADSEKLGTEIVKYVLADGSTLPDGLTLDETTGVISGTPLAAGNYSFDITIVADGYIDKTETFTMSIGNGAFKISDLKATAGTEFNGSISIDGVDSQSYTYVAGELPAGIRLLEDGTITGTAVTPGTYTFNVYAEVVTTEMCGAPWLMLPVEYDYVLEVTMTVAEAPADTTVTDLSNKVDTIASDVDALKKADTTTSESSSGCGSVIGVTGAAIGMAGILAAAIVATKKKQK
jgi:hypothetical protein